MYQFYYDHPKPKYGDNCTLLFTDTDSFCCLIQTDDIYRDMGEHIELFDTSNFEATHPLYSKANHRVLGKFKSETGSVAPHEFVPLEVAETYYSRINCWHPDTGSKSGVSMGRILPREGYWRQHDGGRLGLLPVSAIKEGVQELQITHLKR